MNQQAATKGTQKALQNGKKKEAKMRGTLHNEEKYGPLLHSTPGKRVEITSRT